MKYFFIPVFFALSFLQLKAQQNADTAYVGKNTITLSNVILDNKLNVASFISRVKKDSSFYKAFKNLRLIGFTSLNDIRMVDKDGDLKASLKSRTKQIRTGNCRKMETLEETTTGDFYTEDHAYNYYTAQMYASLFFTKDSVCGEDNIVAGTEFSTQGKSGLEKHKEQLKMLFFNPGRRISGLPFMSNKTAIYDDDMADKYDMGIDMGPYNNINCYIFTQKVKPGSKDGVVVDEMITWFNADNYEVVARKYSLSYDALFYDFKVDMQVEMTTFNGLTVPNLIRYNGNWKAITKKRERGIFTATLFDFK
jgi:hypothetical protein